MSLLSNENIGDLYDFSGSVGPSGENDRADVIRAQTLLSDAGYYDLPEPGVPTGWPGGELSRAVQGFQADHGLQADGLLLPLQDGGIGPRGEGETLQALKRQSAGRPSSRLMTPDQVDGFWQRYTGDADATEGDASVQVAQAGPADEQFKIGLRMDPSPQTLPPQTPPLPQIKPMPLPAHKAGIFRLPENEGVWGESQAAIREQAPDSPVLREVMGRIYAAEGGRLRDPAGTAVGGITAETLTEMQGKGLLPDLPANARPQDLSPDQQITVYRAYLDQALRHVGGAQALERLDPDLAHAIADAIFMDGNSGGFRALQEAINEKRSGRHLATDGGMGPETFKALEQLNADPALRRTVQDGLVEKRLSAKTRLPGERERIERSRPGGRRR